MALSVPLRLEASFRLGASLRLAGVALIAAAILAGCGRKGPLELPPGTPPDPVTRAIDATQQRFTPVAANAAAAPTPRVGDAVQGNVGPVVENPGLIQPPNKTYQVPASVQLNQSAQSTAPRSINGPPAPKPGKPFVLDPLL